MRIAQINNTLYASTGGLMRALTEYLLARGNEVWMCTAKSKWKTNSIPGIICFGNPVSRRVHRYLGKLTTADGFFSFFSTLHLILKLKCKRIELIHMHNSIGHYINVPMLMHYARKNNIPVVWSMHCCWLFFGDCDHHTPCDHWKSGCKRCPKVKSFLNPFGGMFMIAFLHKQKEAWIKNTPMLRIVAPTYWVSKIAKEAYVSEKQVDVIYHGVNQHIFKPTPSKLREEYGCEKKFILLSVANMWAPGKGIEVIHRLAEVLNQEMYQYIVVGISEKDRDYFPDSVITIPRTENRKKLAELYSLADLFVNPSFEETFSLVTAEALSCGTPVVLFGGSGSEELLDENCGRVVKCGDVNGMIAAIEEQYRTRSMNREACIERAKRFNVENMCKAYDELYHELASVKQ